MAVRTHARPPRPSPARVQAILRRLRAWHGGQLQTTLGQLRREQMGTQLEDPFEILIGTLLSHRTRDERTAEGTRALFARFPGPAQLSGASLAEVRRILKAARVGFYNQKAPRVIEVAKLIHAEHGGKVPDTMEGLLELPGVGRKTANCVLVYGFARPAIPVDTHVHRISNRLGLVRTKTPDETEEALMRVLPRKDWLMVNEYLVSYGKEVCRPVGPRCGECVLETLCPSSRVNPTSSRGKRAPATLRHQNP